MGTNHLVFWHYEIRQERSRGTGKDYYRERALEGFIFGKDGLL